MMSQCQLPCSTMMLNVILELTRCSADGVDPGSLLGNKTFLAILIDNLEKDDADKIFFQLLEREKTDEMRLEVERQKVSDLIFWKCSRMVSKLNCLCVCTGHQRQHRERKNFQL